MGMKSDFKEGFAKSTSWMYKPIMWVVLKFGGGTFTKGLINFSLWIIIIFLVMEYLKYPILDYDRIQTFLLMGISAKLSLIYVENKQ